MTLTTPTLISQPFRSTAGPHAGLINAIPQASASPAASFADGFPLATMTPLAAGGVPPSGADMNGILNLITKFQAWVNAGGQWPFSGTLAAAIGGYPKGAMLQLNDGVTLVVSTASGNTQDPNVAMTGWQLVDNSAIVAASALTEATAAQVTANLAETLALLCAGGQQEYTSPGTYSWTCPAGVTAVTLTLVGGGGSGASIGGGGGAGGALRVRVATSPGTTYSIVVGSGGADVNGHAGSEDGLPGTASTGLGFTAWGGAGGSGAGDGGDGGGLASGSHDYAGYVSGHVGGSGAEGAGGAPVVGIQWLLAAPGCGGGGKGYGGGGGGIFLGGTGAFLTLPGSDPGDGAGGGGASVLGDGGHGSVGHSANGAAGNGPGAGGGGVANTSGSLSGRSGAGAPGYALIVYGN